MGRTAWVTADRLSGWAERFDASHGGYIGRLDGPALLLEAADGSAARLSSPWPEDDMSTLLASSRVSSADSARSGTALAETELESTITILAERAGRPASIALILIRRGGYALGFARSGKLLAAKTGTRYVQSRTAAGGWSQQRFARRRENQASAMAKAVAEHAAALALAQADYLLPGGDKALLEEVLDQPAAAALDGLPRLAFRAVPDPKRAVLAEVARTSAAIRIDVTDP
ncbi:acVLRF1 family peptidyl-tRNA hydrolase [Acaricomes phytoseiuli]|uniref:acVLRF1 family peptidyl-tRNA hydrolase n=1 Tax=Acaricomes phytoseiuli TaxID=291968 RepID=UPI002222A9E7|nr:acVLRF1 family peptidyl-tRNA hydrolase [Acaricomes phytoseiuli]MCW1249900.1 acVLRF1 family peptidyl-tRNA hydrolase [Acaricomes phytoseiuli]